jgi:hypothetical protein
MRLANAIATVLLQILHPFAGSIQHYAEEIAVYHPPALSPRLTQRFTKRA